MKAVFLAVLLVVAAGTAQAGIPLVNATCPGGIEVHADEGGPIYINGEEGKLRTSNENYYEAKHGHVTISLSINPDGSLSITYTGKGGANGVCQIAIGSSDNGSGNVAEEACLQAVAKQVGILRADVSTIEVLTAEAGTSVTVKVPDAENPWSCMSDADGNVQGVMYMGEG